MPGCSLGDILSEEELQELVERSDARRAQEKALYLLEHRSHSKRELTEKIARTAASREAAQAAADHLEEIGLVDDRAFAETYARELFQRKRYGAPAGAPGALPQGHWPGHHRPGVGAVPGHGPGPPGENIALVLERRYPTWREDEKARRRAVAALQRLGYSFEQVRAVMGGLDTE